MRHAPQAPRRAAFVNALNKAAGLLMQTASSKASAFFSPSGKADEALYAQASLVHSYLNKGFENVKPEEFLSALNRFSDLLRNSGMDQKSKDTFLSYLLDAKGADPYIKLENMKGAVKDAALQSGQVPASISSMGFLSSVVYDFVSRQSPKAAHESKAKQTH